MDPNLAKNMAARFDGLERTSVRFRSGVVTDDSPLSVKLGNAGTAYVGVARVDSYTPTTNDTVACLVWGKGNLDMIVLGELA